MRLKVKKHHWSGSVKLARTKYDGVEPGEQKAYGCEIDLGRIGKELLPSCKVNMISVRHEQEIEFKMDGCICGKQPKIEVPMIIAKKAPKPFLGFIPPPGIPVQVLGNAVL